MAPSRVMVRFRHLLAALVLAAPLLASPAQAAANAGELDPSFGEGGIATVEAHNPSPRDLAIDHQGRIVAAGINLTLGGPYPIAARLEPDGSLDRSFSEFGSIDDRWCGSHGTVRGIAIDSADRIVLAGTVGIGLEFDPAHLCVVRLLSNGDLDRSFSGDGMFTLDAMSGATDVAIDHQGRILLADSDGLTAIRLTESGALDPTFGEGGIASIHSGQESEARAIAIDSSDRVVLAGASTAPGSSAVVVARFDANGRPDPGFAGTGYETLDFPGPPGDRAATDVTVDQLGRLVLSAREGSEGSETALVARLLPDGSPDASFGSAGRVLLPIPGDAVASAIAVDQAGRVLTTGGIRTAAASGSRWEAFLARLNSDGAIDGSFGDDGVVRPDPLLGTDGAVEVDSAGRYLIAATRPVFGFGVARYLPEAVVPTPPKRHRCHGRRATIVGTRGRDVLKGTKGRDVIVGFRGNDVIRGLGGNDLVCGGVGRDRLFGGKGNDRLFGGKGADLLVGGRGRDRLRGGPGRDVLIHS